MKIQISPGELGAIIDAIKNHDSNYNANMTEIYKGLACLEQDVSNLKKKSEASAAPPDGDNNVEK